MIVAPLLVVWFGFGLLPKLVIIALVCFFPVVVTTLDALGAVDPEQRKLMRTLGASRWQAFRFAEAPAALPAALQRRQDRRRGRGDRRGLRRVRRLQRGPRPPDAQSIPQLETAARLRRRRRARGLRGALFFALRLAERALVPWAHRPQGTDPRDRRLLLAVLLALPLLAAGCGEQAGPTPTRRAPAERCALMLDYFPNADHAGIYAAQAQGDVREGRAGRRRADARRPVGAAEAAGRRARSTSRSPTSPSCCSPATRAAARRRRRAGAEAADVDHVRRARTASRTPAQLKGKTVGTAGIPYQSAYLKTILDKAGVDPASVKEVNVGFNLVPAMLSKQGRRDARRVLELRGHPARSASTSDPSIIRVDAAPACRPTTSSSSSPARPGLRDRRRDGCGASCRRWRAGHEALRHDPATGVDALLKANKDLDRGAAARRRSRRRCRLLPAGRQALRLAGPRALGAPTATGCCDNKLIKLPADPAGR